MSAIAIPIHIRRAGSSRTLIAALAGVLALFALLWTLGLIGPGGAVGAGDNGDGVRLFCGAGLTPSVPAPGSAWQGGVVMDFTRTAPCMDPEPSAALWALRIAGVGHDRVSLRLLGWLYALLVGAITGVAAWALTARRFGRLWVLLPAFAPLIDVDFARFFISTYGEPAGLLGAYALMAGIVVASATRPTDIRERLVAVVLTIGGGAVAGLAKVGYLPVLCVSVVCCAAVGVQLKGAAWKTWLVGPAAALLVSLAVVVPAHRAIEWQRRTYPEINTHNMLYSMALIEMPGIASELGLPSGAQTFAGQAYYPKGPDNVIGAPELAANPASIRNAILSRLARRPLTLARILGIGLQATEGRGLSYLPAQRWELGTEGPEVGVAISGEQGADSSGLRDWLRSQSTPWLPTALVILGILAGASGFIWPRRPWSVFAKLAGSAAVSATGVVLVAVLGDGYFEIAKHVWLSSYLLDVAEIALLAIIAIATARFVRDKRPRTFRHSAEPTYGASPQT
ncbi:MAG: hypothetical protein WCP81_10650 [Actinomycetes bacterium]